MRSLALIVAITVLVPASPAQGPGSCGFHLDVVANLTSTHAAVADLPGAPGGGFAPIPPFVPGNPYTAYATPGTSLKLRVSVPPSFLGPLPFGPGSLISILWSIGTPDLVVPVGPPFVAPCVPGEPLVISVLPPGGSIVDGLGLLAPPPLAPPSDPGHPAKLEVTVTFPPFPLAGPLRFQAAAMTPLGTIGVSNAVNVLPGPNPTEISLIPALVPVAGFPAADEGWAVGIPTPPGFLFYGLPAPVCHVNTNGFIDFTPAGPLFGVIDVAGSAGDLGCAPLTATASPRFAVNHFDINFVTPAPPPYVTDLTMQFAPPGPTTPSRLIIRWKNAVNFGIPPGPVTNRASFVAELWGMDGPMGMSRLVGVRQEMVSVSSVANHDLIGIGPGGAAGGFGGPAPACIATPLWPLYGGPGLFGPPLGGLYMDTAPVFPGFMDSALVSNLAVAFDLVPFLFPGTYVATIQ